MLPKLVQKIRRTLIMSVIMTSRPILMFISLIRNKIYITLLKKLKEKCRVVTTKTMPPACTPGKY